jgi:hypothetical protein
VRPGRPLLAVVTAAWVGAVCGGTFLLWRYKSLAGEPSAAPETWPASTALALSTERHTLVMSLHPKCPCSVASLNELEKLLGRLGERVEAHLLFAVPRGADEGFERTPLFEQARRLGGRVRVHVDPQGAEAKRFGAQTSGDTLLFDPLGRRLFHGGITPSRGHVGENVGSLRIESLVLTGAADHFTSSVYGCELNDHD